MHAVIIMTALGAYRATFRVGQKLFENAGLQDWTSPNGEQYLILHDNETNVSPDERIAVNNALLEFQEYPLVWEPPGHTD